MTENPPVNPLQSKPWFLRLVLARPRLLSCFLLGVITTLFLPETLAQHEITKVIIGWNVGACLYLVLAGRMMFWSSHERMRNRALQQDEGRILVLILVVAAALMCIGAIVAELAVVKDLKGYIRYAHIALAALTIASSWAFTQTMFALQNNPNDQEYSDNLKISTASSKNFLSQKKTEMQTMCI